MSSDAAQGFGAFAHRHASALFAGEWAVLRLVRRARRHRKPLMRLLITGTAGFIGFHLAKRLLADGHEVFGVDGMTPYYDMSLKAARNAILGRERGFTDHRMMLEDAEGLLRLARDFRPSVVVHLAAQAGVRYSLENPRAYIDSNLVGTFNVMEAARDIGVAHLLLASTSSVYGADEAVPFEETIGADHPLTLYAATKKAGEAMTHAYSHLWSLPTTALRFFTVYGPWGRPDMALAKFVDGILRDRPIDVFNHGKLERDFTYVDDLVEAMVRLIATPPVLGAPVTGATDSLSPVAPWRVVNIGPGHPTPLMAFIGAIERALGREARLNFLPMQKGDAPATFARAELLWALTGYRPATPLDEGVAAYCAWHKAYHGFLQA
jgi:UDP-glucuronate 4-epimerase